MISNTDGKLSGGFSADEDGGSLMIGNADGKLVGSFSAKEYGGILTTYNEHEVRTGYFGTNTEKDGSAALYDRYGDVGWVESGKK